MSDPEVEPSKKPDDPGGGGQGQGGGKPPKPPDPEPIPPDPEPTPPPDGYPNPGELVEAVLDEMPPGS